MAFPTSALRDFAFLSSAYFSSPPLFRVFIPAKGKDFDHFGVKGDPACHPYQSMRCCPYHHKAIPMHLSPVIGYSGVDPVGAIHMVMVTFHRTACKYG
jgi:hypothetical protein